VSLRRRLGLLGLKQFGQDFLFLGYIQAFQVFAFGDFGPFERVFGLRQLQLARADQDLLGILLQKQFARIELHHDIPLLHERSFGHHLQDRRAATP